MSSVFGILRPLRIGVVGGGRAHVRRAACYAAAAWSLLAQRFHAFARETSPPDPSYWRVSQRYARAARRAFAIARGVHAFPARGGK